MANCSSADLSDHRRIQSKSARSFFPSVENAGSMNSPNSIFGEQHNRVRSSNKMTKNEVAISGRNSKPMFSAKIARFTAERINWVAQNFNGTDLSEDVGVVVVGKARRVCLRRRRQRRHLSFARIADSLDPDFSTQEKLFEVKEEVIDNAQKARVPVPPVTLPYIGFIHSLTVKNLLCGVLAGAVASTAVAPFSIIRTRAIAGQGGRTAAEVVSTVAREEGLQTLMKGSLKFNIVKNAFEKGLQFTTFEFVKRNQERQGVRGEQKRVIPFLPRKIPIATAGGAAAGLVGTLLSYPLQPIFDRTIVQPEKYSSISSAVKQILRNEGGIREFYRGITPALIAIVPNAAVSFYTYETLKKKYLLSDTTSKPQWVEALQSLIVGGLAGAISTTVTYPLEEARKQIILSTILKKTGHYNNTWQALNGIVKKEGWHGLYRGLTPEILQIMPMTAISFMVYELAKRAFVASGEERRDEVKE